MNTNALDNLAETGPAKCPDDRKGMDGAKFFAVLDKYTAKQRLIALQRHACVMAFWELRRHSNLKVSTIVDHVLAWASTRIPSLKVSKTTLSEWRRKYGAKNLEALVDLRGGDRRHQASPIAWEAFHVFYQLPDHPSVMQCWEKVKALATANGWEWCSYDGCLNRLRKQGRMRRCIHRRRQRRRAVRFSTSGKVFHSDGLEASVFARGEI